MVKILYNNIYVRCTYCEQEHIIEIRRSFQATTTENFEAALYLDRRGVYVNTSWLLLPRQAQNNARALWTFTKVLQPVTSFIILNIK